MRLWPDLPEFSNQMLRYERMPDGLNPQLSLPAHRAMPDAYVTAPHLRDMLNIISAEQLLAWNDKPGLLPRIPEGANRGNPWSRLGADALIGFTKDRDVDIRFSAKIELPRRGELSDLASPVSVQQSLL
ncbi:hypothetical protein [Caulobacter sp. DWR3-1-2]|uniref:hypothetical protein n=1 Tax=Caulobacter sp. DWR3-1-2 TaxID=2804647 RepID=UPI003CEB4E39